MAIKVMRKRERKKIGVTEFCSLLTNKDNYLSTLGLIKHLEHEKNVNKYQKQ